MYSTVWTNSIENEFTFLKHEDYIKTILRYRISLM